MINNLRNDSDIYKITIYKGEFEAKISAEFIDEIVEFDFTINYNGKEIKADSKQVESMGKSIQDVMDEIEALENLESELKKD